MSGLRRKLAVAVGLLVISTSLAVASPASADNTAAEAKPAAQAAVCHPTFWRFVGRHNQNWHAYGCAVAPAYASGNGMYQTFERGQMIWTPNQGGNMIVSGYTYTYWTDQGLRAGLSVQYAASDPFNYDSWLIRLDRNGQHLAQWECWVGWPYPCNRTGGSWVWAPVSSGLYRIVVEGCDVDAWNGHTCRQGWTLPIHVWVAQP